MPRSMKPGILTASALIIATAMPATALAWSGTEHIRHVDQAYQILNVIRRGGGDFYAVEAGKPKEQLTLCPANVCTPAACPHGCPLDPTKGSPDTSCTACSNWHTFVSNAIAAPKKLDTVRTDLDDPPAGLAGPNCGGVYPKIAAGTSYRSCAAGDFPFAPRRGWRSDANQCYLRPGYLSGGADQNPSGEQLAPFFQELPTHFTGSILGQWGTRPDDELNDTLIWIRPTNTLLFGAMKTIAEDIVDAGIAVAIAPMVCIADFLFGGGDCVADAVQGGKDLDLLSLADTGIGLAELYTAGQKTFTSNDFPVKSLGVQLPAYFHFANVNDDALGQAIPGNQFNTLPGFKEIEGGTGLGKPLDSLDLGIIAGTSVLGATVHPYKSTGVTNYTPYADGQLRTVGDWIDPTLGNVEFEPVQNLANWGWDQFRLGDRGANRDAGGARGIGWVMHAIGDADQPHHTISSLGYGHGLWETFADLSWHQNFVEDNIQVHYPHLQEIMQYAYTWWTFLDAEQKAAGGALQIRDFISAEARETYSLPVSSVGGAFIPSISTRVPAPDNAEIKALYGPVADQMRQLMERAIGASMAVLIKTSDLIPAPSKTNPCSCSPGSSRFGQDAAGTFVQANDGICHPCGSGPFQALPLWVDGECVAVCPPDQPTANTQNLCTSVGACPPGLPFAQNGVCIDKCPVGSFVANDRNCVTTCPPNTSPGPANFCIPQPQKKAPPDCSSSQGDAITCVSDSECCSHSCDTTNGICKSRAGETCFTNANCLSNVCVITAGSPPQGTCDAGASGSACVTPADCKNGECLPDPLNRCNGVPGDTCTKNTDCTSGSSCFTDGTASGFCCIPDGESCDTNGSFCCGSCDQSTSTPGTCFTSG